MNDNQELTIIEQREITFYGDEIASVLVDDNGESIFVPVKPICDYLDLSWPGQFERIQRDPVLSEVSKGVRVIRTPEQGGPQEMLCLPLDYLHGWLFGISANRLAGDKRDKVIRYQRECYRALYDAYQTGRLTGIQDDVLQGDTPAAQAYRIAMAVAELARQQALLEVRVTAQFVQVNQRLNQIEATLGQSDRFITAAQASEISQAVKAIGIALSKRSGRNEYGGVYGELYRRFNISGYRQLPATRFLEAMHFLNDWLQSLIDQDTPF